MIVNILTILATTNFASTKLMSLNVAQKKIFYRIFLLKLKKDSENIDIGFLYLCSCSSQAISQKSCTALIQTLVVGFISQRRAASASAPIAIEHSTGPRTFCGMSVFTRGSGPTRAMCVPIGRSKRAPSEDISAVCIRWKLATASWVENSRAEEKVLPSCCFKWFMTDVATLKLRFQHDSKN